MYVIRLFLSSPRNEFVLFRKLRESDCSDRSFVATPLVTLISSRLKRHIDLNPGNLNSSHSAFDSCVPERASTPREFIIKLDNGSVRSTHEEGLRMRTESVAKEQICSEIM